MNPVLHVDLDAFAENLARIRAVLGHTRHLLVVKDDAYGHGLAPLVRRAWTEGVRWFGAFDLATGLAVRAALREQDLACEARVFVWMLGAREEAEAAVRARLDIGIGDAELLEHVAAAGGGRIHLKVDTGLHRNGVRPEDWDGFVARSVAHERAGRLRVEGVWSHLAEASDGDDDRARAAFESAAGALDVVVGRPVLRHLSASAASFARAEFRYDLARVGAFAYGIAPAGGPDARDLGIRPIARLEARVTARSGESAAIALGALHGIPSTLGSFAVATPAGPRAIEELGLTASRIDGAGLSVGDVVVVFAEDGSAPCTATDLAERIDTVGEEILVRVSPLVPRVYEGLSPLR